MTHGIKVSQPGEDVKAAAAKLLSLTTEFEHFKVAGLWNITVTNGQTEEFQHNLGYVPAFIYLIDSGWGKRLGPIGTGPDKSESSYAYADSQKIYAFFVEYWGVPTAEFWVIYFANDLE